MKYETLTNDSARKLKESLIEESNVCPLCGNKLEKPVLDHQHMTKKEIPGQNGAGLVRGVLCNLCNIYLGKIENAQKRYRIKDLPEFLTNVVKYLERENLPYLHQTETFRLKEIFKKSLYNKLIKTISEKTNKTIPEVKSKIKFTKYLTKKTKSLLEKYNIS